MRAECGNLEKQKGQGPVLPEGRHAGESVGVQVSVEPVTAPHDERVQAAQHGAEAMVAQGPKYRVYRECKYHNYNIALPI